MNDRDRILAWIEEERDEIVAFLQGFIRAKSPDPPGDTTEAVGFIRANLDDRGLEYRIIDPQPSMANVVASFEAPKRGRHLS